MLQKQTAVIIYHCETAIIQSIMAEKNQIKQVLLQKLKNLNLKPNLSLNSPSIPAVEPQVQKIDSLPAHKQQVITIADQINLPPNQQIQIQDQSHCKDQTKYKKNNRAKKCFYEHYSAEGTYQPLLEYVKAHPNPSGKPPDIPQQLSRGIITVPKRPWVYLGPENIPHSDCLEIDEKNFSSIFEKAKKENRVGSGILKLNLKEKSKKKHEDELSDISQEFTSNFTFTDSADLSKESDLISEFRSETKRYNLGSSADQLESEERSSFSGSATQKQRYNLFDSSDSEEIKYDFDERKSIIPNSHSSQSDSSEKYSRSPSNQPSVQHSQQSNDKQNRAKRGSRDKKNEGGNRRKSILKKPSTPPRTRKKIDDESRIQND